MSETKILAGGPVIPEATLVQADQTTVVGDGSHERPLRVGPGVVGPPGPPGPTGPPGPPGPSGMLSFRYEVTGFEDDFSELTITLPTTLPSASYNVVVTTQGVARIMAYDVPDASKTTTHFVLSSTADFRPGDRIGFLVSSLT